MSRMTGNFHVRFLGGRERETAHAYPVPLHATRMIYWFSTAQLIAALGVRCVFHWRGARWTRRHTLLCTVVPLLCFLFWTALWWFGVLPIDRLPDRWFDGVGSIGERAFICLPPLGASWLLFFFARGRVTHDENAATMRRTEPGHRAVVAIHASRGPGR